MVLELNSGLCTCETGGLPIQLRPQLCDVLWKKRSKPKYLLRACSVHRTLDKPLHSSTRQVSSTVFQDKEAEVWWGGGASFPPCILVRMRAHLSLPGCRAQPLSTPSQRLSFSGHCNSPSECFFHLLIHCFEWHLLWCNYFFLKANVSYPSSLNSPSSLKRMSR